MFINLNLKKKLRRKKQINIKYIKTINESPNST